MRSFPVSLDFVLQPNLVSFLVLLPGLPLARVVCEFRLIHHDDALFNRADRLAHAASAAGLHVRVIEAVGSYVEAGIRAVQPAECALDTGIKVHHRPHGARRKFFEGWITLGPESAAGMRTGIFKTMARRDA